MVGWLTEAEEDGVNGHGIDAEKQTGNEISPQYGSDNWNHVVIGWRYVFIDVMNPVCEDVEGQNAHRCDDNQSAEKQEEIRHLVQHDDARNVTQKKRKRI